LYEHYKSVPEKEQPETLEEMAPLFAAVAHGCFAGLHQKVLDEIYWSRINRKSEYFITHKLGAFGANLAVLTAFFDEPWRRPANSLTDTWKAAVLNWTGSGLRALGRLREAFQPMEAGLELIIHQQDWERAAINADNLSELMLTLGEVARAEEISKQSISFSDRSEKGWMREHTRCTFADILHHAGRFEEAEAFFREAETFLKKRQPEYPYLYALSGYRFCDLLLTRNAWREAQVRSDQTLEWSKLNGALLNEAMDMLTLGRAKIAQAVDESGPFDEARMWIDHAVAGLREAGTQHYLPLGLLARAAFFRLEEKFDKAREDLTEARDIAERGDMRLHLTDVHLESARLVLAMHGVNDDLRYHVTRAEKLINETGYHRRDAELAELLSLGAD
jgi:tetratricopeptide (TPR) repeat protein